MMECNHRIYDFEKEMMEMELAILRDKEKAVAAPEFTVPCNGCTLCCQGDAIRLLPKDDPAKYQTEPHDHFKGQLMLAHKEDGTCIYLLQGGCSIHADKPLMCKEMDCRRLARMIKKKDLKRYNLPLAVWNRGRQMTGRSY